MDGLADLLDALTAGPLLRWQRDALCREYPQVDFFPTNGHLGEAVAVCERCLVREECLTWAIEHDEAGGVWGGLSERARRQLTRRQRAAA